MVNWSLILYLGFLLKISSAGELQIFGPNYCFNCIKIKIKDTAFNLDNYLGGRNLTSVSKK